MAFDVPRFATQELFIDLPDKQPSPDTESEAEEKMIRNRVLQTPVPEPSTIPKVNGDGVKVELSRGKAFDDLQNKSQVPNATGSPIHVQDTEPKSSTSRAEEIQSRMNELKKSIEFLV